MRGFVSAFLSGCLVLGAMLQDAHAAYPDRPIKIVVPFAPGGPIDAIARPLAAAMQEILGATVVIENRSGAGGTTGSETVANAPPDGYTLLLTTASHIGNKAFGSDRIRYDPLRSFTPIMGLTDPKGVLLIVNKNIPADTIAALADYAKKKPGGLTYGHAGIGGIAYVGGELLKKRFGLPLAAVPYRGVSAAATDVVSGQVDMTFAGVAGVLGFVKGGQVKAIASTGTERIAVMPDVPTMIESGLPDFVLLSYFGMWAPHGTPKEIVERLYESIVETFARPNIRELLAALGVGANVTPPDEFARFLEKDLAVQQGWARELGVTVKSD